MSKSELADVYLRLLHDDGFQPRLDSDGDVAFKFEGGNYIIIIDEFDPEFFRLVYPNFWSIDSEAERVQVERASLSATLDTKVAKVFPVGQDTWATVEMFCSPPESFFPVLRRSLTALQAAVRHFREKMHE